MTGTAESFGNPLLRDLMARFGRVEAVDRKTVAWRLHTSRRERQVAVIVKMDAMVMAAERGGSFPRGGVNVVVVGVVEVAGFEERHVRWLAQFGFLRSEVEVVPRAF
jgi:ribosomal protein L18E